MATRLPNNPVEHTDVLIVGAGLSGIGLAYYLQRDCPGRRYVILESRGASGGTWDLFRYPGIRSDSDLFTFGYEFKPWKDEKAIADAPAILSYLRETAAENRIDQHIRYHRRVISANWHSESAQWQVEIENTDTGERSQISCQWLFSAAGYYRYDEGFTPHFAGRDQYKGTIVHPQHWPENLDYRNKRVLVIGSGATAVTLVPAMARDAAHVTMLQRTPTYVMSLPARDPVANTLRKWLPDEWAYSLTRRKNITMSRLTWRFCQQYPRAARHVIRYTNKRMLPGGYPVDEHFNPPYNPWEQRLCAVPDGDLFKAIRNGRASVVTDRIRTFTETGVQLESGREIEADIIITATGLNVQLFGGIQLQMDGVPVDLSTKVAYKGVMLSDIPNFAFAIGYTNSSWTLKVGLLCEYFCRLLNYMKRNGQDAVRPVLPSADMQTRPLLDFGAGYIKRVLDQLPRQGPGAPWLMSMDYEVDVAALRKGPVVDRHLQFTKTAARIATTAGKLKTGGIGR